MTQRWWSDQPLQSATAAAAAAIVACDAAPVYYASVVQALLFYAHTPDRRICSLMVKADVRVQGTIVVER